MIKIKTIEEIDKLAESGNCIVAKFGAQWCTPCRVLENTIKSLTLEEADGVQFVEIDVDEADESLVTAYSIKSIPVLVYFKDGLIVNKTVGLLTKDALIEEINKVKNS